VCVCVFEGGGEYCEKNKNRKKSVRRFGNKTIDDEKRVMVLTFAGCS